MLQKQNITDQEISLQDKINRAKDAEDTGDFSVPLFSIKML